MNDEANKNRDDFYKEASQKRPLRAQEWNEWGIEKAKQGDWEQARTFFLKSLILEPNDASTHHYLGNVYQQLKQWDSAVSHYHQALQCDPQVISSMNNLAGVYVHLEQYDAAAELYQRALQVYPDFFEARLNYARLLLRVQKLNEVVECLEPYQAKVLQSISASTLLGDAYLNTGRHEQAIVYYESVLKQEPSELLARAGRAFCLMHQKNFLEAFKIFHSLILEAPDEPLFLYNSAVCLTELERYPEAIRQYQQLLARWPEEYDARFSLGTLLMAQGYLDEAFEQFFLILERHPTHYQSWMNGAACLLKKGDRPRAEDYYQRAYQLNPDDESVNFLLSAMRGKKVYSSAPRSYVENLFDQYAVNYDTHMMNVLGYHLPQVLRELLLQHEKNSSELKTLLDLGCGTGLVGLALADKSKRLVGVDVSQYMLGKADLKKVYDELNHRSIMDYLKHTSEQFDWVVMLETCEYLGDLKELCSLLPKVMNEQSIFAFNVEPCSSPQDYQLNITGRYAHSEAYVSRLIQSSGMRVVLSETLPLRQHDGEWVKTQLYIVRLEMH